MSERIFFRPRTYQRKDREARMRGCRRFLRLWHRRCGKDRSGLAFILEEMLKRHGVYFHIFPALNQGRRDLWDNQVQEMHGGIERTVKMIDMFPAEMVAKRDDKEMQIILKEEFGGSVYQVMGCDDDDAVAKLRGPNPIGLFFSEYAHGSHMKKAWDTLSPVLAENKGWAMFAYTPNGFNHGYDLYQAAISNRWEDGGDWHVSRLTVDDTSRDSEGEDHSPVVSQEMIDGFRKDGQREEFIQQEYFVSFTGFEHGTIYGDLMRIALEQGRITSFPYIVNLPVGVTFDLGKSDAMALWFYQLYNNAVKFIDYWEDTQKSINNAAKLLRDKPYLYGRLILPWDGQSAADYLYEVGFRNTFVNPRTGALDRSIEDVRLQFPTFWFEKDRCARGVVCLQNYKRKWDEEDKVFSKQPVHNEYSHAADSLRTGVEGSFGPMSFYEGAGQMVKIESDFDPRQLESSR